MWGLPHRTVWSGVEEQRRARCHVDESLNQVRGVAERKSRVSRSRDTLFLFQRLRARHLQAPIARESDTPRYPHALRGELPTAFNTSAKKFTGQLFSTMPKRKQTVVDECQLPAKSLRLTGSASHRNSEENAPNGPSWLSLEPTAKDPVRNTWLQVTKITLL